MGRASLFSVFEALNFATLSDLRGLLQVILTQYSLRVPSLLALLKP